MNNHGDIDKMVSGGEKEVPEEMTTGSKERTPGGVRDRVNTLETQSRIQRMKALYRPPAAPPAPTRINFETPGVGAVKLIWKPVNDFRVYGYNVYGSAKNNPKSAARLTFVPQVPEPTKAFMEYVDTITAGQKHYYWVTAVNKAGLESQKIPMHVGAPASTQSGGGFTAPPGAGTGSLVGGIINGTLTTGSTHPFGVTGTTTATGSFRIGCQAYGWEPIVYLRATEALGALSQLGLDKSAFHDTVGRPWWSAFLVYSGLAAGSYGESKSTQWFEIGDAVSLLNRRLANTTSNYSAWSCEIINPSDEQPIGANFNTSGQTLGFGATIYIGLGGVTGAGPNNVNTLAPFGFTAKKLMFKTNGTQDGSGSLVLKIFRNNAATSVVATVAAGTGHAVDGGLWIDFTNTQHFDVGDRICFELVNNATAGSATYTFVSCIIVPDIAHQRLAWGAVQTAMNPGTIYSMPLVRWVTADPESTKRMPVARDLRFSKLYLWQTSAGTSGSSTVWKVVKNGVAGNPTLTIGPGTGAEAFGPGTGTIDLVRGDTFDMEAVCSTAAMGVIASWSMMYEEIP